MSSTKKQKNKPDFGRIHLSLLVPIELKERLQAEAKRNGRSMVVEAGHQLEWSFQKQSLLQEVLTLAYGDMAAAQLMRIGATMAEVRALELLERRKQQGYPSGLSAEERLADAKENLARQHEEMAKRIRK